MEKRDLKILLFRYHPYITARADNSPKQEVYCVNRLSLFPPIALAQLAAVLKNAGYEKVEIVDAWAENLSEATFLERVESFNPNIVGCSLWTTNLHNGLPILKKIKQRLPGVTTIVGGPHLNVYPRECLERSDFTDIDFGVVGEGEETVVELIDALRSGTGSLGEIRGIVYREGQEVVFTGWRPLVEDLDSLPYPDFSGLPVGKYYLETKDMAPFIYILSARGCPYRCRYCLNSGRKNYRKHSVDYVISYIKFLKQQYNIKEVAFWDGTFTFDKERTLLFCKRYKEEGIGIPYNVRTKVNHIDEEIIMALKESGCYRIHYGIESGVQKVLEKMNRNITLEQARKAVALTKKHGIPVGANFMIGYIDESRDTCERTIGFIKELDPDHVNIFVTTAYPGTDLYFEVLERKILKRDMWREYALGKIPSVNFRDFRIPGKDYSIDDLDRMLSRAYRRIYFRPAFVLRKLSTVRSPKQLLRYFTQTAAMLSTAFLRSNGKLHPLLSKR